MLNFLEHIVFWYWFALAVFLLIIEVLSGSGFLLWMGISAGITGILVFLIPSFHWSGQLICFAVLAVLTAFLWWLYLRYNPIRTDKPTLNRRGEQYVGRVFTLTSPIVNGIGEIYVDDTHWRVRCQDLPAGTRVKIEDVDGVILIARPVQD